MIKIHPPASEIFENFFASNCRKYFIPNIFIQSGFELDNIDVCALCNGYKFKQITAALAPPNRPSVKEFSRVFVLLAAPLNAASEKFLRESLLSEAGLDLSACSIAYGAHCAPNADSVGICAGFCASKILASQASVVLALGAKSANFFATGSGVGGAGGFGGGAGGGRGGARVLRARLISPRGHSRDVKFVINHEPFLVLQNPQYKGEFLSFLRHLRG